MFLAYFVVKKGLTTRCTRYAKGQFHAVFGVAGAPAITGGLTTDALAPNVIAFGNVPMVSSILVNAIGTDTVKQVTFRLHNIPKWHAGERIKRYLVHVILQQLVQRFRIIPLVPMAGFQSEDKTSQWGVGITRFERLSIWDANKADLYGNRKQNTNCPQNVDAPFLSCHRTEGASAITLLYDNLLPWRIKLTGRQPPGGLCSSVLVWRLSQMSDHSNEDEHPQNFAAPLNNTNRSACFFGNSG